MARGECQKIIEQRARDFIEELRRTVRSAAENHQNNYYVVMPHDFIRISDLDLEHIEKKFGVLYRGEGCYVSRTEVGRIIENIVDDFNEKAAKQIVSDLKKRGFKVKQRISYALFSCIGGYDVGW